MATPIARAAGKKQPGGLDPVFLKDWADRNLAAWDALDAEAVADTCTDDIVWTDPSVPWPIRGRKELIKVINAFATSYPDLKITRVSDPIPLTVPSTITRSNHHSAFAMRPPIRMNSKSLSSSNHHLLSEAR